MATAYQWIAGSPFPTKAAPKCHAQISTECQQQPFDVPIEADKQDRVACPSSHEAEPKNPSRPSTESYEEFFDLPIEKSSQAPAKIPRSDGPYQAYLPPTWRRREWRDSESLAQLSIDVPSSMPAGPNADAELGPRRIVTTATNLKLEPGCIETEGPCRFETTRRPEEDMKSCADMRFETDAETDGSEETMFEMDMVDGGKTKDDPEIEADSDAYIDVIGGVGQMVQSETKVKGSRSRWINEANLKTKAKLAMGAERDRQAQVKTEDDFDVSKSMTPSPANRTQDLQDLYGRIVASPSPKLYKSSFRQPLDGSRFSAVPSSPIKIGPYGESKNVWDLGYELNRTFGISSVGEYNVQKAITVQAGSNSILTYRQGLDVIDDFYDNERADDLEYQAEEIKAYERHLTSAG